MNSLDKGIDLIAGITEFLNDYIRNNGEIPINLKPLWDDYLHSWNNVEWHCVLEALEHITTISGYTMTPVQQRAVDAAKHNLQKYSSISNRAMDIRRNSPIAKRYGVYTQGDTWRLIMNLREMYCDWLKIDLPNSDSSREDAPTPFEQQFSVSTTTETG